MREYTSVLKKITSNKLFWIFVVTHLLLFNINYAEWGDSYRILRASEFIRQGEYPEDEKRQPLFSLLLALRPENVDQALWGRVEMFVFSLAAFLLFKKLLETYSLEKGTKDLALLLFTFNPVLLYWSIRIMADLPFTALVILLFYLYRKWQGNLNYRKIALLGLVVGLASLMRFEGYLLGASLGLGMLLKGFKPEKIKQAAVLFITFLLVMMPWFLYRNPLTSSYLEEPSGRAYDVRMVVIYLASLLYLFGFTSAFFFVFGKHGKLKRLLSTNLALGIFIILELTLALIWPAAIPRLFTPIIPLMIIPLAMSIYQYFHEDRILSFKITLSLPLLFMVYLLSQYFLRLQFLILDKQLLYAAILLQIANFSFIYFKKYTWFMATLILSLIIWSYASISLHKDIFKAVIDANLYVTKNLQGRVAYNDVSSVSDWYLNRRQTGDDLTGIYLNMDARVGRTYDVLSEKNLDYVMITNEHNPTMDFDARKVDHLEEVKEFRYTIRGTEFFTKILKFVD